jgi:tetratricopeptide (TPR) repeat protein
MADPDLARATALLDVNRNDAARELLARVIARSPDSFEAACLMARCHQQSGQPRDMRREADRACALNPNSEWAHRLRSIALRTLGSPAEAVAAARQAATLSPHGWEPWVVLAGALLACSDRTQREEAREAIGRALAIAPDRPAVRVEAGRVYGALGDERTARAHYEYVLASDPGHAVARNNLAIFDLRKGRTAAAAGQFASVLADRPGNGLYLRNTQLAAQLWLARAQVGTTLGFLAAWAIGSAALPSPVRLPLAVVFGVASVLAGIVAYRRLPPGVARLVRWPSVPLRDPRGLRTLRLVHVATMGFAVAQVVAGCVVLTGPGPWWVPLRTVAIVGSLRAAIFGVRSWAAR